MIESVKSIFKSSMFSNFLYFEKVERLFLLYVKTNIGMLLPLLLRTQYVTWYVQTQFLPTDRRNFQTPHLTLYPILITILRWIENFNSLGNFKNWPDSTRL